MVSLFSRTFEGLHYCHSKILKRKVHELHSAIQLLINDCEGVLLLEFGCKNP